MSYAFTASRRFPYASGQLLFELENRKWFPLPTTQCPVCQNPHIEVFNPINYNIGEVGTKAYWYCTNGHAGDFNFSNGVKFIAFDAIAPKWQDNNRYTKKLLEQRFEYEYKLAYAED